MKKPKSQKAMSNTDYAFNWQSTGLVLRRLKSTVYLADKMSSSLFFCLHQVVKIVLQFFNICWMLKVVDECLFPVGKSLIREISYTLYVPI